MGHSILDAIGNTPLVEIKKLNPNPAVKLLAKLECFNPGGSVKDRAALYMIEAGERSGELTAKNRHRTHQRKYRDRSGPGLYGQGIPVAAGNVGCSQHRTTEDPKGPGSRHPFNTGASGHRWRHRRGLPAGP